MIAQPTAWRYETCLGFIVSVSLLTTKVHADTVVMNSGNEIECIVIQENSDSIVIRKGYGTMIVPRNAIARISKLPVISAAPATRPATARMPGWETVVAKTVARTWAKNLQPIPATVVDKGVMKHVPYQSYRCADDYEINIYGDPDAPAAVEIGVYRGLLKDAKAKDNCIELMAALLTEVPDGQIVRALDKRKIWQLERGLPSKSRLKQTKTHMVAGGSRCTTKSCWIKPAQRSKS